MKKALGLGARSLWSGSTLVALAFIMRWAMQRRQIERNCIVTINFVPTPNTPLVTAAEIRQRLASRSGLLGKSMPTHPTYLNAVATHIAQHSFVRAARVYQDWRGGLHLQVHVRQPIACFVSPDGKRQYVDDTGCWIPRCNHYTPQVLIVYATKRPSHPDLCRLVPLLQYIHAHRFWRAQLVDMELLSNGEVTFTTQIGHHKVLLGAPDDFVTKLAKLYTCYRRILPQKGWRKYTRINLAFSNQIICS